ncbi:cellulose synthase [Nonomuraea mesophila]|uniref:Cellulose synthase n=1 Tax=Nonomuraea mesophila TaxID=2530382 RepID=A0A4R5FVM0_9ACTN|nr:cellulose synthase [Nonomuraea mesophila]TDE58384.1 cellulose synthase [Nonomuraea mesophila]
MSFDQFAWLPLCAGATIAGLVLSFLAFRRRGAASGLRVTAWALLPLAAYLTDALRSLWTIGVTVVGFVTGLVFNPQVWAGVAVAGLSAVLFVVSGVMRGKKLRLVRRKKKPSADGEQDPAVAPSANKPAVSAKPQAAAPAAKTGKGDDDFSDIEELLKRRGIS